jgi:hypothetical protein
MCMPQPCLMGTDHTGVEPHPSHDLMYKDRGTLSRILAIGAINEACCLWCRCCA